MLLRELSAERSGSRRAIPLRGVTGLLLLVAAVALAFPVSALARGPASIVTASQHHARHHARNPATPTAWVASSPYPINIVRYAFAQVGENLYVIGGVSDGDRVSDANKYNATTNTWSSLAPIPVASEAPAGAYLNGKIYVAEGDTGNSFQIYDIATNAWSSGT